MTHTQIIHGLQKYHKENLKHFELNDKCKIKCQNLGDVCNTGIQRNFIVLNACFRKEERFKISDVTA